MISSEQSKGNSLTTMPTGSEDPPIVTTLICHTRRITERTQEVCRESSSHCLDSSSFDFFADVTDLKFRPLLDTLINIKLCKNVVIC